MVGKERPCMTEYDGSRLDELNGWMRRICCRDDTKYNYPY